MSSNMRIQKVCEGCGKEFIAKTTVTRCCGDRCAKRLYKRRKQQEKLERIRHENRREKVEKVLYQTLVQSESSQPIVKELLNTLEMAFVVGVSKRSFQRQLAIKDIPRIYIGKRILFRKEEVLNYLHQQHTK